MRLPKELTTVTPLSRIVAVIVLAAAMLIGFALGINYQETINLLQKQQSSIKPVQVGCTEDTRICPDGTNVGRQGPSCEFVPCPTVDPNETRNWKTYENIEQKYSIKYPPEWFIGKDGLFDGNVIGAIRTSPVEEKDTSVLRIEIHTGNLSYERYAYFYHLSPKASLNSLGRININGSVWEKFSNSDDVSANNNLYVLGTTHNNKKYFLIKRVSPESKNAKKESALIDQILSTFKFLD